VFFVVTTQISIPFTGVITASDFADEAFDIAMKILMGIQFMFGSK
jgi:hypothetical protein